MGIFTSKKTIKLDSYPGIDFYPVHQLIKQNNGQEPYFKSVQIGGNPLKFTFFKINGTIYCLKPTDKNKHISKEIACKVSNPLTLRSASGSITGNCAKGVRQEYIDFISNLNRYNISDEEKFKHIILNIDHLE